MHGGRDGLSAAANAMRCGVRARGEFRLDTRAIRDQFPITRQRFRVAGRDESLAVIYMDHAASTHPPTIVLDTYRDFLERSYSNVHRGSHYLSQLATDRFEEVREVVRSFISARGDGSTIMFLGNTTQALDLAAHVMEKSEGVTLVSLMEHHSNDLPHRARGTVIHFGVLPDGTLDYEDLDRKLREHNVKLVTVTGASNVTGYTPDIHRIARMAHAHGARILVDAARSRKSEALFISAQQISGPPPWNSRVRLAFRPPSVYSLAHHVDWCATVAYGRFLELALAQLHEVGCALVRRHESS